MAFDIEKMKADGVSSHLIELASMNQETFLLLIARRLENDKFFQQFLASNVGSIEGMYPYAVAAGLMSEEDRKWLIDEENPYKSQDWYIMSDPIPKGSEDYPIGRYKSNTDFTWSYEGEPTNVAVANDELVEIYRDAGTIKARQSGKFCTGWASANVDEANHSVTAFLTPCEI